jgi:acetyltransferase
MKIALFDSAACDAARDQLAYLLLDALANGPALGFWPGLGLDAARRYWREVGRSMEGGSRVLVAAVHGETLLATGQLALCQAPEHDCAEVRSMIVHSGARRRGIGSVLVRALEAEARARGRDHLFLDTEPGSGAEALCVGLGYDRAEGLPAAWPSGARYRKTLLVTAAA